MDLYLQFGYGMMAIADELLANWGGGGVILSPRDLDGAQLDKVAKAAHKTSAEVLLDPQCYLHAADHERLTSHVYWQRFGENKTANLIDSKNIACLMALQELNVSLCTTSLILPGLYADALDDLWWSFHEEQIAGAIAAGIDYPSMMPTLALSSSVVRNESAIDQICDRVRRWAPERLYVVAETTESYLSDDPLWLAGVLQLCAGLKLAGKKLLVGYANHQLLPLGCAGVDAIASGTWLNVRAFQPEKFMVSQDDEISRRAKGGWYYCPQALSEYKMPMLDVAQRVGILDAMKPVPDSGYADPLFAGAQPSLVNWGERNAFMHYLSCLRAQCSVASSTSYDGAREHHAAVLDEGRDMTASLRKKGIRGADRDFGELFDISEAALALLDAAYGARLRRLRPSH